MASKEPKKEDGEEAAAPPPAKSKKLLIIIAGVAVLTLAAGAGIGFMLGHKKAPADPAHAEAAADEKKEAKKKEESKKPPVFLSLDPFTVNLQPDAGGGDQFLQVVVALRVADEKKGEELRNYMPQIRHEILNLTGSKKASEITSPDGREMLAEDIQDVVNEVLGFDPPKRGKHKKGEDDAAGEEPPVQGVFFTQFIVQ